MSNILQVEASDDGLPPLLLPLHETNLRREVNVETEGAYPRPREEIQGEINLVRDQLFSEYEKGKEFYEKLKAEDEPKLIDVFNKLNEELSQEIPLEQIVENAVEQLSLFQVDRALGATIVDYWAQLYLAERKLSELGEEFKPYLIEDIKSKLERGVHQLDYAKVLQYYNASDSSYYNGYHISDFFYNVEFILLQEFRSKEGLLESFNPNKLEAILAGIEQYQDKWDELGFMRDLEADVASDHIEGNFSRQELVNKIESILADVESARMLLPYYQSLRFAGTGIFNEHLLDRIASRLEGFDHLLDFHDPNEIKSKDINYPQELLAAIDKLVEHRRSNLAQKGIIQMTEQEYTEWCQKNNLIDHEEIFSKLKISGFDNLTGELNLVSLESLLEYLRENIPPFFLKGINELNFVHRDGEEKGNSTLGETTTTYARNTGILKHTNIDIFTDAFQVLVDQYAKIQGTTVEIINSIVRTELFNTVSHEIGHSVHHSLCFHELRVWDEIIKNNPNPIDAYEQSSSQVVYNINSDGSRTPESDFDHQSRSKKESFAISFALYVTNPALLKVLDSERYRFMSGIFRNYSLGIPNFAKNIAYKELNSRLIWAKNNLTEEYIRKMYLP